MINSYSINKLQNQLSRETSSTLTSIVSSPETVPLATIDDIVIINDEDESNETLLKKRRSTRTIPMTDVSRRLNRRKILHKRLYTISNFKFYFGLIGVILMIIENEFSFMNIYHKQTILSCLIKTIISITTIILVSLVICYYSLDTWHNGLTSKKVFFILLEIFICSLHPFPRYFPSISFTRPKISSSITRPISLSYVETDVALSLPMFARIYLLCRYIMYHSYLVHNASSQSIGYLNQVTINFMFLIKTYLEQWPARCLLIVSISIFFISSWSLRACNYTSELQHLSFFDSMWLFIVTFTTVGYGDLLPSTYCGRSISAIVALIGILSTALLISVVTQKLTLTRSEKYVHHFVLDIALDKQRKHQAANIIKCALRVWLLKRKHRPISIAYMLAQRRLVQSIHLNQQLKYEQKKLVDSCIGFPEVIISQREANVKIQQNVQRSILMQQKMVEIEGTLVEMKQTMTNIQNSLNLLLNKVS